MNLWQIATKIDFLHYIMTKGVSHVIGLTLRRTNMNHCWKILFLERKK